MNTTSPTANALTAQMVQVRWEAIVAKENSPEKDVAVNGLFVFLRANEPAFKLEAKKLPANEQLAFVQNYVDTAFVAAQLAGERPAGSAVTEFWNKLRENFLRETVHEITKVPVAQKDILFELGRALFYARLAQSRENEYANATVRRHLKIIPAKDNPAEQRNNLEQLLGQLNNRFINIEQMLILIPRLQDKERKEYFLRQAESLADLPSQRYEVLSLQGRLSDPEPRRPTSVRGIAGQVVRKVRAAAKAVFGS